MVWQLPFWLLSAILCLALWPQGVPQCKFSSCNHLIPRNISMLGHLQGSYDVALVPKVDLVIEKTFRETKTIYSKLKIHLIIFFWVFPSQRMGKSLEIAARPDFFLFFRVLVPRLVQHKIVAEQILQISFVSIKLMLGNTWDLRTLWHNKILRPIKDQFSGIFIFYLEL